MRNITAFIFSTLLLTPFVIPGMAQDEPNELPRQPEGVTVKGRIVQHEKKEFEIDLNALACTLNQQVELPDPPIPTEQWPKMNRQQREQWVKEFEASEAGKAFIADRKKRLEEAERFEIQVEDNGNFVVYDVPPGKYGIRGRAEKTVGDKNYAFEIFGGIEIAADEVLLDPMAVVVTGLTKPGEPVPAVDLKTFDGKETINNTLLDNRNILVSFWSLKSPPSVEFAKTVQQAFQQVKQQKQLQLLSICVDSDREQALQHVVKNNLGGWHGYVENWDHDTIREFGVRSIPALYLLGADGKIKLTPREFRYALNTSQIQLSKIILDVLNGKALPTPVQTGSQAQQKDSEPKQE